MDEELLRIIDLFDDDEVTTADKIDRPQRALDREAIDDFMKRNPMAGGGMLVQPSADGSRPGYAKQKQKFISGPGTKTTALDDPKKYKIVKKYLNKVKTQKNKRIFLDWSEQIKGKPNPWYEKLKGEVKLTRQPLNELINKVISEEFPTAYSGKAGKAEYAREMTVKSFINYWNQNGMFDGNEKLSKPLEQFVTSKKGTPNNYENINRYFTQWRDGKFEVDGVDRKNLDKGLLQAIKKWKPNTKGKRSDLVKKQLVYLNNLSPNLSYDRVTNLFAQKFPDSEQTLQHRLNQLTQLKRNGAYSDGTGNPKKIPGIEIGERSGWLKEGYGKGFLGNYGRLIKKADELRAAGESKFAIRLEKAADKFFGPTGIFTKAAGEGEHPLSRNMGDGPIGNQLKINSLVSGDLNQFKKFNFDSPVRNLVLEYENPNTTSARKKEIKLEIENRKKLMNILTEGPNQKGIVDSVKFNYGVNKIGASVDVPEIDKIKNFDINEFITRGEEYRTSVLQKGKDFGLVDKKGQIIKQTLNVEQVNNLLLKLSAQIDRDCAQAVANGGRIGLQAIGSRDVCITKAKNYARDQVAKGIPDTGVKGSLIKRIFKSTNDFVKSALDPKELFDIKKQFFSKGAIASLPIFDAGIAGYEALAMNKPVKEAISDTFTFGSIPRAMGIGMDTSQVMQAKNLLNNPNLSPAGKEYAQLIIDQGEYEKLQSDVTGGVTQKFNKFNELQNKIKNASTAGRFDYESLLNEIQATQLAKDEYSPLIGSLGDPLKNRAVASRTGTRQGKGPVKIDLSPITYQNFQPNLPLKEDVDNYLRSKGIIGQDQMLTDKAFQREFSQPAKFQQLMETPGFKGTQDRFAGGGIAKLAGVDQGPPPASGPNPQGLQGLMKRVRNL